MKIYIFLAFAIINGERRALADSENNAIFKAFQAEYCSTFSPKYQDICNKSQNSVDFSNAIKKQAASEACGKNFLADVWKGFSSESLKDLSDKCGTVESKKITDLQLAFFRGAKSAPVCEVHGIPSTEYPGQK